jgi:hypothetical protein
MLEVPCGLSARAQSEEYQQKLNEQLTLFSSLLRLA